MTSDIKPDTQITPRNNAVQASPRLDGAAAPARFGAALGDSAAMRSLFGALERVAPTDTSVLLEGEPGTGKRLLARSLHEASARSNAPLVVFDCTASVASLELDLFGQERANSGAPSVRKGALEGAEGSTLVLDEISELPLELQAKLAQALETREYKRVDGQAPMRVGARIVATSTRDLKREVERGKFSAALLAKLSGLAVQVPPLRSRREDIRLLADAMLKRFGEAETPPRVLSLTEDSAAALAGHEWPGNAVELAALLKRSVEHGRLTGDTELRLAGLPGADPRTADPYAFQLGRTYRETRARFEAEFERRYVKWLLGRHHGNISAAAREVQMDRKYLYDLAKKHGMRGKEEPTQTSS